MSDEIGQEEDSPFFTRVRRWYIGRAIPWLREHVRQHVAVSLTLALLLVITGVGFGVTASKYAHAGKNASDWKATAEWWADKAYARQHRIDRLESDASSVRASASAVAAQQAEVSASAEALASASAVKQSETITGGSVIAGQDVPAGTYHTTGPNGSNTAGCYYAFMSGTGSDASIINNDILTGPGTVTLNQGQVFETSGCNDWTKTK